MYMHNDMKLEGLTMSDTTDTRPFGYWLRTVDALLHREFAAAFENEGASRRDWMLLSIVAGDRAGGAERLARKGKRLRMLEDRGWIVRTDDGWELTDEGRAAKERLGAIVDGIRARVSGAVSSDDFATTMATLEAVARELGWDEGMRMPRRGFGRRFGHRLGFGPGGHGGFERGFGEAEHAGHGRGCHGHHPGADGAAFDGHRGRHPHHEHRGHRARRAERAYERGFTAGFDRGRDA